MGSLEIIMFRHFVPAEQNRRQAIESIRTPEHKAQDDEALEVEVQDDDLPLPSFPNFFANGDDSIAYWSTRGYHWNNDDGQWENNEGRIPSQEDPVQYHILTDEFLDQFENESGTFNAEYWEKHGFNFDPVYEAWRFSHGDLEGRLPSQVLTDVSEWGYLDETLEAFCCVNGCYEFASFPLRLKQAYISGWFEFDEEMYCPNHAHIGIDLANGN